MVPDTYKDSDPSQQKSRKCVFWPFLNRHQKKLFYSLFQNRPKYYESSKTEYSDPPSFINRFTPLIFFSGKFQGTLGRKGPPGSLHGPNWPIFLHRSLDNRQTRIYSLVSGQSDFRFLRNKRLKIWWADLPPPAWLGLKYTLFYSIYIILLNTH